MVSSRSGIFGAGAGIRCTPHFARDRLPSLLCLGTALLLALSSASEESLRPEAHPPPSTSLIEVTDSQAVLEVWTQVQEQLRATQLAIEQNRWEVKQAVTKSTEVMFNTMQTLQESIAARQARDLEVVQRSNKVTLLVAGLFTTISSLAMFLMSYLQWRMSQGLARISAALPLALALGPGRAVAALGPTEQSRPRLLAATEPPGKPAQETERISAQLPEPREVPRVTIEPRLYLTPGVSLRRRPIRALRTAVIVGLVCAAALALLLFLVTHKTYWLG